LSLRVNPRSRLKDSMKSKLSNNDETAAADFEGKQGKSNAIDYSVAPPLFNSI